VDLSSAYLLQTQLVHTNLDKANITGCCIYNWQLEDVDLSTVKCAYVFTQFNPTQKEPCDRLPVGRDFAPGELDKHFQTDRSLVDLYFTEAVNWESVVYTLAQLEVEEQGLSLTIKGFEPVDDNVVIKLATSRPVNGKQLTQRFFQVYNRMTQTVQTHRQQILDLLGIASVSPAMGAATTAQEPEPSSLPTVDRRSQLYKEVVRQIQHILVTQTPDQMVGSVQRLLDYLSREGFSTTEIQRKIIGQAIVQRAKRDAGFRDRLLQWQAAAPATLETSIVGQAMRLAATLLKS